MAGGKRKRELTRKQQIIARELANPENPTYSEVARKAKVNRDTVRLARQDPAVQQLAKVEERKRLDKARGELGAVAKLRRDVEKAVKSIDINSFNDHDKVALLEKSLDLAKKELELRQLYPDATNLEGAAAERAALVAKAVRVGRYLETRARRRLDSDNRGASQVDNKSTPHPDDAE